LGGVVGGWAEEKEEEAAWEGDGRWSSGWG